MRTKKRVIQRNQINLFETSKQSLESSEIRWELPDLSGEKRIALDTETTGLAIWRGDVPVGLSVSTEDFKYGWYIPWGHKEGFNYDLENVKLWVKDNIYNKHIDGANFKFDLNMLKHVGIDLEEGNNQFHDVMHPPALLYPKRQDLDLDSLVYSELGKNKVHLEIPFKDLPAQERNSASLADYAIYDAKLTSELARHYAPKIAAEGLGPVLELEDAILPCVAHMERQGAMIDVERLHAWRRAAKSRYLKLVLEIYKQTGLRVEPTKATHLARLFTVLKIPYHHTPTGLASITNADLIANLHFEPVKLAYEAKQLLSIESRFFKKVEAADYKDGIIRYALNQLKAVNDEGSVGAVTGRFSSSGGGSDIKGVNIQQVMDDEKQGKIPSIADFPIRDLFIPSKDTLWLSADAMQIEFRLFAHYSQSLRLSKAYSENPLVDFHDFVAETIMFKEYTKEQIKELGLRKLTKNLNFGKLYGLGIHKLAEVYLHCSYEEAKEKSNLYNKEFPEALELMNIVKGLAETRGYVKTIMRRKHNFKRGVEERYYAALNYVIQGSAADIMKKKLLLLYQTRKETGFNPRFTVHDEVDGDIPDKECAIKIKELLNVNDFPQIKIPILWTVGVGNSWMNAGLKENMV